MTRSVFIFLMAVFFPLGIGMQTFAHDGATGVVKERMDRFKESQRAMKAIATALTLGELDTVYDNAAMIEAWANEMIRYFPEGSNPKPSEALDVIWQKPDAFLDAITNHATAAQTVQALALEGNKDALPDAFRNLAGTCKACHQQFRY